MADGYKFKNANKTGKQVYAEITRKRQALVDLGTSLITAMQTEANKREKGQNPPRSH